jgi:hypothetical protein
MTWIRASLVGLALVGLATTADAACRVHTLHLGGRIVICTTCCAGLSCTTTCA